MKSTGVIKKMDELGRIVIPKEMRRVLNIQDGEVLELFVNDDNLVLKKHSSFEGTLNKIKRIIDLFDELAICKTIVVDKNNILVNNLDIGNTSICNEWKTLIINRAECVIDVNDVLDENIKLKKYGLFCPLITELDSVGGVLLIFDSCVDDEKKKVGRLMARLVVNVINNSY